MNYLIVTVTNFWAHPGFAERNENSETSRIYNGAIMIGQSGFESILLPRFRTGKKKKPRSRTRLFHILFSSSSLSLSLSNYSTRHTQNARPPCCFFSSQKYVSICFELAGHFGKRDFNKLIVWIESKSPSLPRRSSTFGCLCLTKVSFFFFFIATATRSGIVGLRPAASMFLR